MDKFEVILCIVNSGFAELVMDTAKQFGAKGGTVLNARGTVSKEAEKIFNITIQPEKEIVMILVVDRIKDNILQALHTTAGTHSPAQGIAFTLPVESVVGIGESKSKKQ